ncbi:MAG: BatA domain-containing protein, partial [Planctomycetes bacterium]|nr:BatA domain-containing protein [Planctomycetota bacterium]
MKFVNPSILWALPFALTPIIIYYLMRYRSLRVFWGANYVLERALERLRKKLYLDQIILIAIRVLVCLLVVFAFARPLSRSVGARISGSGRHHVVIADGSYSMRAGESGSTRWDRAKETMKNLVASWGRGEKWSLLLLGHSDSDSNSRRGQWVVEESTVKSREDAIAQIEALEPGETSSSIRRALQSVREKYGDHPLDVYLFADDQASAW